MISGEVEVEQGLTSHQTHYGSYRERVLRVKRYNQQCESTEGKEGHKDQASIPPSPLHEFWVSRQTVRKPTLS